VPTAALLHSPIWHDVCVFGASPPLPSSLADPSTPPSHPPRPGVRCRLTASIMLVGGGLLTGSAGNDGQFLAMFLTSLFIFGTGKLKLDAGC